MGCLSCFKSPNKSKNSLELESSKEDTGKRKRRRLCCFCAGKLPKDQILPNDNVCGGCFMCSRSPNVESHSTTKEKCWMSCFSSKKSSKDDGFTNKEGKCGMPCFGGRRSPKDGAHLRPKEKCNSCFCGKKSSKDDCFTNKEGKCGMPCFGGRRSPKDEAHLTMKEKCKMSCFCGKKSSKDDGLTNKEGKCGLPCFGGTRSPKDEAHSVKKVKCRMSCFCGESPSKDDGFTNKEGKCGMPCFVARRSPKGEAHLTMKEKRGMSCFCGVQSSKDDDFANKKGKCGMPCFDGRRSPKGEAQSTMKEKCRMSCFCGKRSSKDDGFRNKERKCCMPCFGDRRSPTDETHSPTKEKHRMCCFCGKRSSKDDGFTNKERKCRMPCFGDTKPSPDMTSRRKRKGCMSCFPCSKPKKEEPICDVEEEARSGAYFKSSLSEGKGCFACFKSSKVTTRPSNESCLCCFTLVHKKKSRSAGKNLLGFEKKCEKKQHDMPPLVQSASFQSDSGKHMPEAEEVLRIGNVNAAARVFTYRQLAAATQDFAPESFLGRGGFGKVYKGYIKETNEIIAVKQLDSGGGQGNREFLIEVLMLSLLSHPNLVTLLGYCVDGDQRFLVYDYMSNGSLQDHLIDLLPGRKPLDWNTRMKIAAGAAKGLEHLHDIANPPVIYGELKASNILLDEDYNPRLADIGLAKLIPVGPNNHISTRVMGTFGYCAPEYASTGQLTKMSDVYIFGVVLLELITGRKAVDERRPRNQQILSEWAMALLKDKQNLIGMADPLLEGKFPEKALNQAIVVAEMCLQKEDTTRPRIKDIVRVLQSLAMPDSESSITGLGDSILTVEDQLHLEQQSEMKSDGNADEKPHHSSADGPEEDGNADEIPHRSSYDGFEEDPRDSSASSDWQSCSTLAADEQELDLLEVEATITSNADPQTSGEGM